MCRSVHATPYMQLQTAKKPRNRFTRISWEKAKTTSALPSTAGQLTSSLTTHEHTADPGVSKKPSVCQFLLFPWTVESEWPRWKSAIRKIAHGGRHPAAFTAGATHIFSPGGRRTEPSAFCVAVARTFVLRAVSS